MRFVPSYNTNMTTSKTPIFLAFLPAFVVADAMDLLANPHSHEFGVRNNRMD
jgi:hypothetical protein